MPGVSITTVSRFTNNIAAVRDGTAKKIVKTIHSPDYPLSESFITSNTKKDGKVILISMPSVPNPSYNNAVKGAQDAAPRHNYYTLIDVQHLNSPTRSTSFNPSSNINFCGAIILNAMDQGYFSSLYHTIPSIQCREYMENQSLASYTSIDDVVAAETMMEYILSTGHTRIAFLRGSDRYKYAHQRKAEYLQTLEAAHIPLNKGWIIQLPGLDFNMALSSTHQFTSQKEHPTAVFAVSDALAIAAIRGYRLAGLSIPANIIAAGSDNVNISQATSPPITTINQPKYQMGYMVCELLIEKPNTPRVKPR